MESLKKYIVFNLLLVVCILLSGCKEDEKEYPIRVKLENYEVTLFFIKGEDHDEFDGSKLTKDCIVILNELELPFPPYLPEAAEKRVGISDELPFTRELIYPIQYFRFNSKNYEVSGLLMDEIESWDIPREGICVLLTGEFVEREISIQPHSTGGSSNTYAVFEVHSLKPST